MKMTKTLMVFVLAVAVVSLAGCPDPGTGDQINPGAGFSIYTAGNYGDGFGGTWPAYWLGTTRHDLTNPPNGGDYAKSIFVSGTTVYVAGNKSGSAGGYYWDNTGEHVLPTTGTVYTESMYVSAGTVYTVGSYWSGPKLTPCYWVGTAAPTNLDFTGANSGQAFSIFVTGGTVYTAGYVYVNPGLEVPCYWAGTAKQNLDLPVAAGVTFEGEAVAISYDGSAVNTAGYYTNTNMDVDYPCYWTGTTVHDLPIVGTLGGRAASIVISGGHTYIAGYYITDSANYLSVPCYWVDGTRYDLAATGWGSTANSICVTGGVVFTAGSSNGSACYWANTYQTNVPDTDTYLYSIYVP